MRFTLISIYLLCIVTLCSSSTKVIKSDFTDVVFSGFRNSFDYSLLNSETVDSNANNDSLCLSQMLNFIQSLNSGEMWAVNGAYLHIHWHLKFP